ncbi:hypothetical protein HAV22_26060 [Massilia sp. TW-1]|uniref:Uncharacterized protein n=1 Tax=Telluria antibiotica TaxID=2717319 RepID=A0ABX0PJW7_9BURK|nr:hypothetical protein [Telluria antibiotica]NIA57092.1 hypothetical protein [Telluria antibiotica]
MSWDVSVQRFGKEYESIADIPDTERCMELGSQTEIRRVISPFFPGVDWSDSTWGIFDSDDGSVEFNMGGDEPSTGFMMHIRASTKIVPTIVAMCRSERWQALDCSGGVFLERAMEPNSGLEDWATYRDHVTGRT